MEKLLALYREPSAKYIRADSQSPQGKGMLGKPEPWRRSGPKIAHNHCQTEESWGNWWLSGVRHVQPLRKRAHPGFRYEGPDDPSRFSPEKLTQAEVFKRTCRVLDDVDKLPLIPTTLFNDRHPPEEAWVST